MLKGVLVVGFSLTTGVLVINAIGVLFDALRLSQGTLPSYSNCKHECNSICSVRAKPERVSKPAPPKQPFQNPTFEPVEFFLPPEPSRLGPITSRDSLTRVGSELHFDYSICPSDSAMKSDWRKVVPAHSSCPAVFIVGARKAGTTSLYQYLSSHPNFEGILLDEGPKSGETFHFSARYSTETWDKYMSRFPKQYIMTGDASVGNFVNCKVPKRIFESCGNFSKIVILLRNPIDRYVSNFMMRVKLETKEYSKKTSISRNIKIDVQSYIDALMSRGISITTALGKGNMNKWNKFLCLFGPSVNMVYESLYYIHVLNWLCNYPAENILFLNSEEFYMNTLQILKQLYQFLGLEDLSDGQRKVITSVTFNKGTKPSLPQHVVKPTDRKKLQAIFRNFNDALFKQLGWDGKVTWN